MNVQDFDELLPHCKHKPVINQIGVLSFFLVVQPSALPPFLSRTLLHVLTMQRRPLTRCCRAEYHPYVLEHLKPNLDIMKEHNILIQAYRPLTPLLRHPTGGPIKPILEKIAARLSSETGREVDAAMALLLWIRTKGVISVTASSNEERIKKLALTQELRDLTKDEVDEIDAAGCRVHFRACVRLDPASEAILSRTR